LLIGQQRVVYFKRIVGARMLEKPAATFETYYIPETSATDLEGELKVCTFSVPGGHAKAVFLCDAIDCLAHGLPPESTKKNKLKNRQKLEFNNAFFPHPPCQFVKDPLV
jgi:hypothetical protein